MENGRGKHRKFLPFVLTEHGAIMAASVLNSPRAIEMSILVVLFDAMRGLMATPAARRGRRIGFGGGGSR